jgi:hypothetical protein
MRSHMAASISVPLLDSAVKKPICFERAEISKMSGRSSGSPPERISAGTRKALSSSMTRNTSAVLNSPAKSLSAEIE